MEDEIEVGGVDMGYGQVGSPHPNPDPHPDPNPKPKPAQVRRVRQLLAPFVLRRVKADVQPQMAGKVRGRGRGRGKG